MEPVAGRIHGQAQALPGRCSVVDAVGLGQRPATRNCSRLKWAVRPPPKQTAATPPAVISKVQSCRSIGVLRRRLRLRQQAPPGRQGGNPMLICLKHVARTPHHDDGSPLQPPRGHLLHQLGGMLQIRFSSPVPISARDERGDQIQTQLQVFCHLNPPGKAFRAVHGDLLSWPEGFGACRDGQRGLMAKRRTISVHLSGTWSWPA